MRALCADRIKQIFIDATDKRAIDQSSRAKRAIAEAVNGFDGEMTGWRSAVDFDALFGLEIMNEILAAHGLAGFGAAEFDHALAGRGLAEVVIKGDRAENLGL